VGPLTFYFDRNCGRRFPEALRQTNPPFTVEYHHSQQCRFAHNAKDDEWLSIVGQRGWTVFSHDRKFHTIDAEKAAIKQHNIGCFYLWGAEQNPWTKLCLFVKVHQKIMTLASDTDRPFIWHVKKTGRFSAVSLE
jgi:hypothetical protein